LSAKSNRRSLAPWPDRRGREECIDGPQQQGPTWLRAGKRNFDRAHVSDFMWWTPLIILARAQQSRRRIASCFSAFRFCPFFPRFRCSQASRNAMLRAIVQTRGATEHVHEQFDVRLPRGAATVAHL
jgi:hypothetical protein